MIESMLEPHLKDSAGANQTQVGLTFLILGGVYMATTPITGYVRIQNTCDPLQITYLPYDRFVTESSIRRLYPLSETPVWLWPFSLWDPCLLSTSNPLYP